MPLIAFKRRAPRGIWTQEGPASVSMEALAEKALQAARLVPEPTSSAQGHAQQALGTQVDSAVIRGLAVIRAAADHAARTGKTLRFVREDAPNQAIEIAVAPPSPVPADASPAGPSNPAAQPPSFLNAYGPRRPRGPTPPPSAR